jgi:hypothetical protein
MFKEWQPQLVVFHKKLNELLSPWCEMHRGLFRSDWFRLIPNNPPNYPSFLCSTAYLSVNYSHREKISRFLFGGSGFSSYLCQRL